MGSCIDVYTPVSCPMWQSCSGLFYCMPRHWDALDGILKEKMEQNIGIYVTGILFFFEKYKVAFSAKFFYFMAFSYGPLKVLFYCMILPLECGNDLGCSVHTLNIILALFLFSTSSMLLAPCVKTPFISSVPVSEENVKMFVVFWSI